MTNSVPVVKASVSFSKVILKSCLIAVRVQPRVNIDFGPTSRLPHQHTVDTRDFLIRGSGQQSEEIDVRLRRRLSDARE